MQSFFCQCCSQSSHRLYPFVYFFKLKSRDWPANYEISYSFSRFTKGDSLGIGFGWRGHCCKSPGVCQATSDPLQWGWPLEGITWVRGGNSLEIWNYQQNKVAGTSVSGLLSGDNELVPGHFYRMRTRVQQVPQQFGPQQTNVKVRLWKDGSPEPSVWQLTAQYDNDPETAGRGSVFLLSYNTDAQFGPVEILPVPTLELTTTTTTNPTTTNPTTSVRFLLHLFSRAIHISDIYFSCVASLVCQHRTLQIQQQVQVVHSS